MRGWRKRLQARLDQERGARDPLLWLERETGRSRRWWMDAVQQAIREASYRPAWGPADAWRMLSAKEKALPEKARTKVLTKRLADLKKHDATDTLRWLFEIAQTVVSAPSDGMRDGNMRAASILGAVLCFWVARVARAKSYDPRRPREGRRRALTYTREWQTAVVTLLLDESADADFFLGQKWEDPFSPDATDGSFV